MNPLYTMSNQYGIAKPHIKVLPPHRPYDYFGTAWIAMQICHGRTFWGAGLTPSNAYKRLKHNVQVHSSNL